MFWLGHYGISISWLLVFANCFACIHWLILLASCSSTGSNIYCTLVSTVCIIALFAANFIKQKVQTESSKHNSKRRQDSRRDGPIVRYNSFTIVHRYLWTPSCSCIDAEFTNNQCIKVLAVLSKRQAPADNRTA